MRKAINFFRSYYDIANELNEKDRLLFYDAIMNKQFENIEPTLIGMSKFAYLSQKHSIDAQIKGYFDKTKDEKFNPINGGKVAPTQGGKVAPTVQVQVQVQGKEEEEEQQVTKNEFSEDVIKIYDASIKLFSDDLKPTNEKQKNIWLNEFDKLIRLDNLTIGQIYSIIKFGRSDDFWKDNFLSILKLRKKNKEDMQYWKVFKHKSELNINNNTDPYKTAV